MYQYILFDLDGTLTDPGMGITNSVRHALKKFGIEAEDRTALYKFIGPPLKDSFMEYYGFTEKESDLAIEYYREYIAVKGLFENEVYPGMEELLGRLKAQGRKLIVATSKPELFAVEILKHFHLYDYFDFVSGATMDMTRVKKTDVIDHALRSCGISDLTSVLMVGDREHDINGAKAVGVDSLGVEYGYGSYEELREAGATYIAKTVSDISGIIERRY